MGFSNTEANLLTVPVQAVGGCTFILVAYFSDKYQMRSPFIVLGMSFNLIGMCPDLRCGAWRLMV